MLEDLVTPKKPKCKVGRIRDGLEPSDQKILDDALANPDWSSFQLARELTKRGLNVSRETLVQHRQGSCNC